MAKLLLGPVLGKVTDTTARVLVETDRDAALTLTATDPSGAAVTASANTKRRSPLGISLTGLAPSTTYELTISGAPGARPSRIRTFPTDPERMNLAVVSCNFTIKRGKTDLWSVLRDRYVNTRDVDLVLHVGDQVYGDQVFAWAINELGGRTTGTLAQQRRILERYRELYRLTWSYAPTADVLANVPSLMIWDDHEIRDDWGSRPADSDPATAEYHVGTLARQVFREYQRQLWDPNAVSPPRDGFEHHMHSWGRIGVLFVDQRGGRSFQPDAARPYLGTPQWQEILTALTTGAFSQCEVLVVATSVPLAYMGMGITQAGRGIVDDLVDHWALPAHQKEQLEFLRALRRWKEAVPGQREVIVVGGDVHVGGHTDIEHKGNVIFKQLISSPITNKPPNWFAYAFMRGLLETNEKLGWNYSFEHHNMTRDRNFGLVLLRTPIGQSPFVTASLVTG